MEGGGTPAKNCSAVFVFVCFKNQAVAIGNDGSALEIDQGVLVCGFPVVLCCLLLPRTMYCAHRYDVVAQSAKGIGILEVTVGVFEICLCLSPKFCVTVCSRCSVCFTFRLGGALVANIQWTP